MKNTPIVNHGTLIDTINYEGLIKAQANNVTFLGKPKKVVSFKNRSKANVKTLRKVPRSTLK